MKSYTTGTGTICRLKDESVCLKGTEVQDRIIDAAAKVYAATDQKLVVTSANDGEHMEGSKHYSDEALDLRVWELSSHEEAARKIGDRLGSDFDALAEWRMEGDGPRPSHLHIEYDPS